VIKRRVVFHFSNFYFFLVEYIPFIRQKILEDGIVPVLLHFGETGYIRAHNIIKRSELEIGEEVAKGLITFLYFFFIFI